MSRTLLFAGFRRGALAAARRLGLEVFGLGPLPPRSLRAEIAGWATCSLGASAEELEGAVRALLGDRAPDGIAALVEAAVLPAARLRAALGVQGDPPERALLAADKVAMKRAAQAAGVPVARWIALAEERRADVLERELGLPIVLKRARSSGGRGVVVCRDREALQRELRAHDLAEGWIEGIEMSVESLVLDGEPRFANPTEYVVDRHVSVLPAELEPQTLAKVLDLNRAVIAAVGPRHGIAHVELFLTAQGPLFGELAARPPGGRLMECLERAYAFDFWECALRLALGERPALPPPASCTAGVWLLHPGPGRVVAIEGEAEARAVPGVELLEQRAQVGDIVNPRLGTGQDLGRIEASGPDRDAVVRSLREAHARLRLELE